MRGWIASVIALLTFSAVPGACGDEASADRLAERGLEVLRQIRADLYIADSGLYADGLEADGSRKGPAFMWGCGVMLSALNAATRWDPSYAPRLRQYADALQVYWNAAGPVPGYDVLPAPKPVDRYYDDNAWVVLALLETHELLGDDRYVDRAERTMAYVLSGLDDQLAGGIYWRERDRLTKNTCSNAPSALAAYRLHLATGEQSYRELGDAILSWTLTNLQDPADGLMWDHISLQGDVEKTKWSYNTGLAIRALSVRAEVSDDPEVIEESIRQAAAMARAGLARWQDGETGAFRDDAAFAHLFAESLLALDETLPRPEFAASVLRALGYLYERARDQRGHYPKRWEALATEPLREVRLIDQASAARAYLVTACTLRDRDESGDQDR